MGGHELISFLEGIRQDIPGPLQNDFEELIQPPQRPPFMCHQRS
jgi:hypothetical protein